MAARAATAFGGRTGQRRQLHTVGPLSLAQGFEQRLGRHRLDQVAHVTGLQHLGWEVIPGGTEHHGGW
ncbi:hypothetical protein D3C80_1830270 [compost metagenome]